MSELYLLKFPNGKGYVGVTATTAAERFKLHCEFIRVRNLPVCNAIRKYGKTNVSVVTLVKHPDVNLLFRLEKAAIKLHGTKYPEGYNLHEGGKGGRHEYSVKARAKMRESAKRRGIIPGSLAAMWAATRGKSKSTETRRKMRQSRIAHRFVLGYCDSFKLCGHEKLLPVGHE